MPTKIRQRGGQDLSPSWVWYLLTGDLSADRANDDGWLPGWVAFAGEATQGPNGQYDYGPAAEAHWRAHGEALMAEAQASHFRPHYLTGRRPTGDGYRRWRQRFLDAHRRPAMARLEGEGHP